MKEYKTCSFIGHRKIEVTNKLKQKVKDTVENLIINHNVNVFLFGSRSEFNNLCHLVVTELKEIHPNIIRKCYTCKNECAIIKHDRAKFEQLISKTINQDIPLCDYDEEVEHKTKFTSGKSSYIQRNQAMINDSDFCVFYYNKNYKPEMRKYKKSDVFEHQPNSGTSLSFNYAKQKKKQIINIC